MEPCSRKKRETMESLYTDSDWSSLPRFLLVDIAKRTLSYSVEDFMAFRGVCTSWRAAPRENEYVAVDFVKSSPTVPFLMLAEKEGNGEREFYSLPRRKICMRLPMPETKGKKCIESRFGWLLTVACSGEVELMNPFSGVRIALPNFKTGIRNYSLLRSDPEYDFISRSVLSANPSYTSHFVVVVITTAYMTFCRPGDKNWTKIHNADGRIYGAYYDINYFSRDRRFYAINRMGDICVWDADASVGDFTPRVIFTIDTADVNMEHWDGAYLVESSASELLLLVTRNGQEFSDLRKFHYGATEFRVYQIDIIKRVCKRIRSLKREAIFVGHNAAFSIPILDSSSSSIKSNCIYFTDDSVFSYDVKSPYRINNVDTDSDSDKDEPNGIRCKRRPGTVGDRADTFDAKARGGKDMGIYNLEDGSIQRLHPDAETLSFTCPPLWVAPSTFSWLR